MGDRIAMDAHEPAGGADTAAFRHVGQQRQQFLARQLRTKQRRSFAFGKACLAGAAIQQAKPLVLTKPPADRQISAVPLAILRTGTILTAKSCWSFHSTTSPKRAPLTHHYVEQAVRINAIRLISAIAPGHHQEMRFSVMRRLGRPEAVVAA
jgi:hypothetical protein